MSVFKSKAKQNNQHNTIHLNCIGVEAENSGRNTLRPSTLTVIQLETNCFMAPCYITTASCRCFFLFATEWQPNSSRLQSDHTPCTCCSLNATGWWIIPQTSQQSGCPLYPYRVFSEICFWRYLIWLLYSYSGTGTKALKHLWRSDSNLCWYGFLTAAR